MPITLANGVVLMPIHSSPNSDYMAGSDGQVYSRTRYKGFGRKEYVDWYPLKGHKTNKDYLSVSMSHQNEKVTRAVHRVICEAFHGPAPTRAHQTRHLDGNPQNNLPTNLAWGTQAENWQDRQAHGHGITGEKHHAANLTNFERKALRWAIQQKLCSQRHAAAMLGITQSSVSEIVLGDED